MGPEAAAFADQEAARFRSRFADHPQGFAQPPPGGGEPLPGEDGGPGPPGAIGPHPGPDEERSGRHQGHGSSPGGPAPAVARHHGQPEPDPGRRRQPPEKGAAAAGGPPDGPARRPGGGGPEGVHPELRAQLGRTRGRRHAGLLPAGPVPDVPGIRQGPGPVGHLGGQHHPGGIHPGPGGVAAPGTGPPLDPAVSRLTRGPDPLLPGDRRAGPARRTAHPGGGRHHPAPRAWRCPC